MSLTKRVVEQAEALSSAEKCLAVAIGNYGRVKGLCGQRGYSLTIDGVQIAVAVMDERTYQAKLVRGREMIHLGALKALDSVVDDWRENVKQRRLDLAETADKLACAARGEA